MPGSRILLLVLFPALLVLFPALLLSQINSVFLDEADLRDEALLQATSRRLSRRKISAQRRVQRMEGRIELGFQTDEELTPLLDQMHLRIETARLVISRATLVSSERDCPVRLCGSGRERSPESRPHDGEIWRKRTLQFHWTCDGGKSLRTEIRPHLPHKRRRRYPAFTGRLGLIIQAAWMSRSTRGAVPRLLTSTLARRVSATSPVVPKLLELK
jgi:hypothetical protein